jgi:acyl carrier protein
MDDKIRAILKEHGRLNRDPKDLGDNDDLLKAGLTSHANVNVMLALENEFEIEFPDHLLKRESFETIAAIRETIRKIRGGEA